MSTENNIAHIQNSKGLDFVFPSNDEHKKMTLVFTCLSCLICLMMIAIASGIRASDYWGHAFDRSYVLELRPVQEMSQKEQLDTAMIILSNDPNISDINVIEGEKLQNIMEPWLGDNIALDKFPLSRLIEIQLTGDEIKKTLTGIKKGLADVPGASVEAYHEAKAEYKTAGHAIHLISTISAVILLIIAATITTVSIEMGVLDNRKIVNILHLIGAENKMISKLFLKKILSHAIKGTFIGMIVSIAVIAFIAIIGAVDGLQSTFVFSHFIPGIEIIFLLFCVPLTIMIVGYVAGKRTLGIVLKNFG